MLNTCEQFTVICSKTFYEWAEEFQTVDIAKGNSYFAHVPYIESRLRDLFERLSRGQHLHGLNQLEQGFTRGTVRGKRRKFHAC
jgi:cell filamentation protein